MIMYCANFVLDESELDTVVGIFAEWVSNKVRRQLAPGSLKSDGRRRFGGICLDCAYTDAVPPTYWAARYTELDNRIRDREWVVECGLRRPALEDLTLSVLLRMEEHSARTALARLDTPVSRPSFVPEILDRCIVSSETAGTIRELNSSDDELYVFKDQINNPERRSPIILVSRDSSGDVLVDPKHLLSQVFGLAEVVVIARDADSRAIAREIGWDRVAKQGAVTIIWPRPGVIGRHVDRATRIHADQIREWAAARKKAAVEILSFLVDLLNPSLIARHIGLEYVQRVFANREMERRLQLAVGSNSEESIAMAELLEDARRSLLGLEKQVEAKEAENLRLQKEIWNQAAQIETLKAALRPDADSTSRGADPVIQDSIAATIDEKATVEQALHVISWLFPDRVVVLDSAWNSAKRSEKFIHKKRLFDLLWKLVTSYWCALADGEPDQLAGRVFGESYTFHDSKSVESNLRARSLRKFEYEGRPVEMMKHLKIGVKDSVAETIRIHFEWFNEERRIVIGHCGRHLDHG